MSFNPATPSAFYIDPTTGQTYPLDVPRWRAESGRPLMITPLPGIRRNGIDASRRSLWRYAAAFPIAVRDPITLGEGLTPLIARDWRGARAHFKLDFLNPSGSFKDRGASVMLSILRQQGVVNVLEDSSGNGGAAIAAYAAAGEMKAKILAPSYTQPGKTVQMRAYGAETQLIAGTRQDTSAAAEAQAGQIFYASHAWQPFFIQGTKTLAYELWEDLGFEAPDNIIIPTGGGSSILGCDIGFDELKRSGEIDRRPRLFAAQPENCAPLHATFLTGGDTLVDIEATPTVAEGTSIAKPVRAREVIAALRRSRGGTVALSEDEILAAHGELARNGLYVEPTCASAAAALTRLTHEGTIRPWQTTVLLMTGAGLKATQRIGQLMGVLS